MNRSDLIYRLEIFMNVCLAAICLMFATFLMTIGLVIHAITIWFMFAVFVMLLMRRYMEVKKNGSRQKVQSEGTEEDE